MAGIAALRSHIGDVDDYGNELGMTEVAEADELASAAELVAGKLSGVPVVIIRGYEAVADDGRGAAALIRNADEDLFRVGAAEAFTAGRQAAPGAATHHSRVQPRAGRPRAHRRPPSPTP